MIENEREIRHELAVEVGRAMLTAARTAPKTKGVDILECVMISGDVIKDLTNEMLRIATSEQRPSFERDAKNILDSECVVIIGTKRQNMGINCGYCGVPTCNGKPDFSPCAFNVMDIGIAVGSACSVAADRRVDTRVMFSAGYAFQQLGLMNDCCYAIAIPISISAKSPYFDRSTK